MDFKIFIDIDTKTKGNAFTDLNGENDGWSK